MNAIVLDTNCIAEFQNERLREQHGAACVAIEHIFGYGHIALDEAGKCIHEWLSTAQGPDHLSLSDWISEQMLLDKIRLYNVEKNQLLKKQLIALGLPPDDLKWFQLSVSSNAKAIVSEDIDLYHPAAKTWAAAKKEKIKETRDGCICSFARKKLSLLVIRISHVTTVLA